MGGRRHVTFAPSPPAPRTCGYFAEPMETAMFRLVHKNKILKAVVIANFIVVMYFFVTCEISAKVFFHYQAVFGNVVADSVRMVGFVDQDVAAGVNRSASLPIDGSLTLCPGRAISCPHFGLGFLGVLSANPGRMVALLGAELFGEARVVDFELFAALGAGQYKGTSHEVNLHERFASGQGWVEPSRSARPAFVL